MKTAREIFRATRKKQRISLKIVAEKTKIPLKYLQAIEKGDYQSFPGFHYAQLYVRDYARFLHLSPFKMVSLFRRDWEGDWEEQKKEPSYFPQPLRRRTFFSLSGLAAIGGILLVGGYLFRQYLVFNSPPPLEVRTFCLPGKVIIEGQTSPQATVKIEEKAVLVESKGQFKKELLFPWPKTVVIQAESPSGKIRQETVDLSCSS